VIGVQSSGAQQAAVLSPDNVVVRVHQPVPGPLVSASSSQLLVYDSQSLDQEGSYELAGGLHTFCLSGGGRVYTKLKLTASNGELITPQLDRNGCGTATLPAGITRVKLWKRAVPKIPAGITASVRVDPLAASNPAVPLVDVNGNPIGGYWAIQDTTVNALGTFGNRVYSQTPLPGPTAVPAEILLAPNVAFDGFSLWQFPDGTGNQQIDALLGAQPNWWSIFISQLYVVSSCGNYCGNAYGDPTYSDPPGVQIKDKGNYQFTYYLNQEWNLTAETDTSGNNVLSSTAQQGDNFQVIFRFFPDGTKIGTLQPGEVALYQGCGQQSKAAVFIPLLGGGVISPPYNLTALSSTTTTLDGTTKSIAVGPGSSVYWGTSSSAIQGAAVTNTSCLSSSPTGQIFVEPLLTTLTLAHDQLGKNCANCSFRGVSFAPPSGSDIANFSNWNLTGADFTGATIGNLNLSDATLTGAKFIGSTLSNITFDGAQLNNTPLDFSGATLTNVTFKGVDITNFKFIGATLNNVDLDSKIVAQGSGSGLSFTNAILNQVNLSGLPASSFPFQQATLCGVSLSGSDAFHPLNLTSGNFNGTVVTLSSACAANLSYTVMTPSASTSNNWNGMILTGAVLNFPPNQVLSSQAAPLNLAGATLTGTTLEGVVLDYSQGLAGQDLTGTNFSNTSLRFTNLSGAQLYGATLTDANLEGANMSGALLTAAPSGSIGAASLVGAFLRNVNLFQARLSGANFAYANFYSQGAVGAGLCTPGQDGFTQGCATASQAVMDGTNFSDAYLFGVDFTYSTGQGVNFSGAALAGANFNGATEAADSSGTSSSLSGALLQGATMTSLTLNDKVTFSDAYADFTAGGNTINMVLSGEHTGFAGYWGKPGESVCAQMVYAGPTTVPATNANTTCPNSREYSAGCGGATTATGEANTNWESKVDITAFASYVSNSTFTPAPANSAPQICTSDPLWIPLVISPPGSKPPTSPHRPTPPHPPTQPHPPKPPSSPQAPKSPRAPLGPHS